MEKIIITYNDIYDINVNLEKLELRFKLHLHDVCGSQSFTIEELSNSLSENKYDEMKKVVIDYFDKKSIKAKFLAGNLEFVLE